MVYDMALWAALILLGIGVVHRIDGWFLRDVGLGDRNVTTAERLGAAVKGGARTVFGPGLVKVLKVVVVDVLLQARILRDRREPMLWLMHICIFWGFILLLVFHALGSTFGGLISSTYVSTLNPFLFLRNLFGVVMTVGLVLAVVRRVALKTEVRTGGGDVLAIVILAVIACSGFVLEGVKITADSRFDGMVKTYAGGLPADQYQALKAYWVADFGLVPAKPVPSHDPTVIAAGKSLHEAGCQGCHAKPTSAFASYALSRVASPVAASLDRPAVLGGLWYLHVLACCVGLAYLAFSKMFHVVSTPVSLLVAEVAGNQQSAAAAATRQALELDGCSHGGACHEECPVRVRRMERIGPGAAYEPMLTFTERKSPTDLGSRPVSS